MGHWCEKDENVWEEVNPLSANPTKWSNTIKPHHFVGLALKWLRKVNTDDR